MVKNEDLVFTDDLTKVFNRRFLLRRMKKEIGSAEKNREEFSIILIDIDHFKIVNDSFGHLAGDEALKLFAGFLKDSFRKNDIVCRYAGDEFVIILPISDMKRSLKCGKRIIDLLDKKEFSLKSVGAGIKLSTSMGIAGFPGDAKNPRELLKIADKGLYEAKRMGGSRIIRHRELREIDKEIILNFEKFVGRNDTLSLIKTTIETVSKGEGKVLFITGEIGIGKTRLIKEAMRYADLIGFKIFEGRAHSQKITPPYFLFGALIKNIIRDSDTKMLKKVMKGISVWQKGLRWIAPDIHVSRRGEKGIKKEAGEVQKHYLFEAITRFLGEISKYGPIFLFLDNLQWSGEDDIEVLRYVIRNFEKERILIAGAYRESEIVDESPLKHLIRLFSQEGLIEKIALGPLSDGEIKELISVVLGLWDVPPDIVSFLNGITEGNPLFIIEVLKILIEKGYVYKTGTAWNFLKVKEMVLPERISDILKEKMESLSYDARDLLMTAAVMGELFSLENLRFITGENEGYLIDLLDEGLKRGVIFEGTGGVGEYCFVHRMMQTVFYNSLSGGKRSFFHRKVGEMIESFYKDKDEKLEELAYHFRNAGQDEKALSYYLFCAKKAEDIFFHQKSIELYTEAMKLAKKLAVPDSSLFDIYYRLGLLYSNTGKLTKAEEFFSDSLKLDSIGEDKEAKVFHKIGNIYMRRGGFNKAIEYYKKAKQLLQDISSLEGVMLSNDEAEIYLEKGEYLKAFELAQDALKGLGDEFVEEKSVIYNTLGNINYFWGKLEDALKFYNKSLSLARKCANEGSVAVAYKNIGRVSLEQGKKRDAERFFNTSLESAQKIGDIHLMGKLYNNLGIIFAYENPDKARENYMKSLDMAKRIGDDDLVATIFNNIADLYMRKGELRKALSMFEEALRIWELIGTAPSIALIYLNMGKIYFLEKNFEKSFYYLFMAKELSKEIKYVYREISAIINLSRLLIEQGKEKVVYELIEEAEELNKIYKSEDYAIHFKLLRAILAFERGNIDEAKGNYEYIIEKVSEIGDRELEKEVEVFGGKLFTETGEYSEAMRYFKRAKRICEGTGNIIWLVPIMFYEAVLLQKKGEAKKASGSLQKARKLLGTSSAKLWIDKIDGLIREIRVA